MITRIELNNFMSHKHTVIEPATGLTVLVGPNNVGKSAIVAALQILCHNENSTYVMRHGEQVCSVAVQTDDGHAIEWRRKNAPSYVINGQIFDRLRGSGLPDELHQALRLPKIDTAGDADFDVHFGTQKSPIFLLGNSGAIAARFFASSSDAIRLVTIQKRHKEKLSDAQREKNRLEVESRRLNAELGWLEPIVAVDHRLATAENAYDELVQLSDWLGEAKKREAALWEQVALVARREAHAAALSALSPPPDLFPLEPLKKLITAIEEEENNREAAASRADALSELSPPPELAPSAPLANLIATADTAEANRLVALSRAESLARLTSPPPMHDVAFLAQLTEGIATQAENVERGEVEFRSLSQLSNPPRLADSGSLQRLVKLLDTSQRQSAFVSGRNAVLRRVAPPPELASETAFLKLVFAIVSTTSQSVHLENELTLLAAVTSPPIPMETREIAEFILQLEKAADQVRMWNAEREAAYADFTSATAELREQAAGSYCLACGSALDPDRVIARAAAGLGVHDHD